MIEFQRVNKLYANGQQALTDLSFTVAAAEMLFVTGHSGAGKSTLLKLLGAMEKPTQGSVILDGVELSTLKPAAVPAHRRKLGMVFQDHRLLLDRTVFANVELPLVIAGLRAPERARRVRAVLEKVGLLKYEKQSPQVLSTGEQQRVGIARALVRKPTVLIADEPTGNLDPQLAQEIMQLFMLFQEVGTTILIASHDLQLIKGMRKRVLVLDHGRMVDDIPATEVV